MKISFNPSNSNKNILDLIKNNKDIIFDLKGHSIFARGVELKGTDTNTWRPVVDNLTSDSTTSSLSAKQGKVLKALIDGKSNSDHNHDGRYVRYYAVTTLDCNNLAAGLTSARISATNAAHTNPSAYLYISDVETPFQIQIPDSSIPYIYKRYYGSGKWSGWFKLNAGYADSAGSVAWANVTEKPSSYTPSAHTHTVFKNNLMIKGTNGISDSASIHLGIGDSDTGFKWISDGVCQIYANNAAVGQWTSGGMDWFKNPTVNGNKVWNSGNDGSGSGLDSDLVDGLHASRFPIYYNLDTSSTSNHWYKLGTARISESDNIMIHIYSGDGWNSNAYQNAYATLMIKTGNNPNGDLTREFGATMVNHHHSNMTYKLISPSTNTVDIWVKIPWGYSSGWYSIHGEYSSYTHSGASQSAEPTGNAQTGVETLTNAYTSSNVASATNADMVDGYHENSFLRYRGATSTDQEATLWSQIGIKQYNKALPDNLTGVYSYGSVISLPGFNSRFEIYASDWSSDGNGLYYRSGWNSDKKTWLKFIDSSNIGSQTVANAYHLRINSANTWSTWYWAGQSGQPSWLWGSNDGTNMYVWNPSNFNVNTAQYLRSLGNQNCQTGRTQAYGDVYSYNTHNGNTGSPTTYSSVIGFGRGIAGTVEIAGGWCNTHLYWRSLKDCCEDWFPWRTVLDSSNYTEFINNYYWANVKISASSSTTTSPTFSNVYLGNSLYLNNRGSNSIYNGPNDSANGVGGPLNNLVFSSWQGVSFTTSYAGLTYTNKNAVSINCRTGQLYAREVQANGFMHTNYNSNDAVLLAGGGYKTLKDFIFLNKSYSYTDNKYYNLSFHKLSGICNNLVWVDGHVKGYIAKSFVIDPAVFPYRYNNDSDLNTVYLMTGNNYITINASGVVTINNATDHKQRVGFFYTGRA